MPLFPIGSESSQSGPVIVPPGGSTGPLQQLGQTSGAFQPTDDPLANRPVHQIDALTDLPAIRGNDEAAINQEILAINDRLRAIITDLKLIFGTIADSRTCKQLCQDNILQVDAHSDIVATIQRLPPGCVLQLPFICFPCPPPCEPAPATPSPPAVFLLIATDLICVPVAFQVGNREATITVVGGSPPYIWITDDGSIVSTGVNTAKVTMNAGMDYFKPYATYTNTYLDLDVLADPPSSGCTGAPPVRPLGLGTTVDGNRVIGYDCSGQPIGPDQDFPGRPPDIVAGVGDFFTENSYVTYVLANATLDGSQYPTGDVDTAGGNNSTLNRNLDTCNGDHFVLNDPHGWQFHVNRCCQSLEDPISMTFISTPAGRLCMNGIVHAGAPNYSEVLNLEGADLSGSCGVTPQDCLHLVNATQFIDVRTAEMLPGAHRGTVTVIDSTGLTAIILLKLPV